jgi:hypothetical protein
MMGILPRILDAKGLPFPIVLMFLVPALMWLTFPSGSAKTLGMYPCSHPSLSNRRRRGQDR